jgi:2-iminobutanoate/2-iminopropanoate deaminase
MRKIISSKNLPSAIGTYSVATLKNNFLFTSGQIAIDKTSSKLIYGGMKDQALKALDNIYMILKEAGLEKNSILKLNVYVTDLDKFDEVNIAFELFFKNCDYPARTTIEVSALPMGASIEIDCVAGL